VKVHDTSISVGVGDVSGFTGVLIEQEDWAPYTGYVTTANMVRTIASYLYNEDFGATVNCGMVDGNMATILYVYPLVEDLAFELHLSRGTLSGAIREDYVETESVFFKLTDSKKLKYPGRDIVHTEWLTSPLDSKGADVNATLSVSNGYAYSDVAVYGTAIIKYNVTRYSYSVVVEPRAEADENLYNSVAYAVYQGGVVHKVLDPPPNSESYDGDAGCIGGVSINGSVSQDEDDLPEDLHRNANRVIVVDYCAQETITDEIYAY
jgi:hypothetical protein